MDNKRIYVTGYQGFIGSKLIEMGCSPLVSDITDAVGLDEEIAKVKPKIIIHLAAITDVDFCEREENLISVYKVNVDGSFNVFEIAEKYNVPVVFISSDHIFNGERLFGRYAEPIEDSDMPPLNNYGLTKFMAEAHTTVHDNVKVVRTSSVISSERPSVKEHLHSLLEGEDVYPPVFIWRSFMHVNHFCQVLLFEYVDRFDEMPKYLNISGSKTVSWWRLVKTYAKHFGFPAKKVHARFRVYKSTLAPRPFRTGLDTSLSKSLGLSQFDYLDAVLEDCGQ